MNTAEKYNYQTLDVRDLEAKVKDIYKKVAENPHDEYHFAMGLDLALRLGYDNSILNQIPINAIDSFAGVGHYFDLAQIKPGERVIDLGSGSGMDSFIASLKTGSDGEVVGIDMTESQLRKATSLARLLEFTNAKFTQAYLDSIPYADHSFDVVISNGVINLVPDKLAVFREATRILKSGGRLAISDIVTEKKLAASISCDAGLWAACIGGAMQIDEYIATIEEAGLRVHKVQSNPQYHFLSDSAQWATDEYGVKSISILAVNP